MGLSIITAPRLEAERCERDQMAADLGRKRAKIVKLTEQRQRLIQQRDDLAAQLKTSVDRGLDLDIGLERQSHALAKASAEVTILAAEGARLRAELEASGRLLENERRRADELFRSQKRLARALGRATEQAEERGRAWFKTQKDLLRDATVYGRRVELLVRDRVRLFDQPQVWKGLAPTGQEPAAAAAAHSARLTLPSAGDRPLKVLVAGQGQTLFEYVENAKLSRDPSDGPFDVAVILKPEGEAFAETAEAVPEPVWEAVRQGKTRMVWDGSSEAMPHWDSVAEPLARVAAARRAAPNQIVCLTQNRSYERDHIAYCARTGSTRLRVVTFDYYVHRMIAPFLEGGTQALEDRIAQYYKAARSGRRAFLSLNLTPRAHKVLLLTRLLRDGLWDRSYISFGGFEREGRGKPFSPSKVIRELDWEGFGHAADEITAMFPKLNRKGIVLFGVGENPTGAQIVNRTLRPGGLIEYRLSWFSAVTESEMRNEVHRITEKIIKPILNLHPFIVFGNPGSLRILRSYGFQTFPEMFDEAYDEEQDCGRRFDMAYAELRRLAELDEASLERIEAAAADKVLFNARWAMTELPRIFQKTLLPATLKRIMADGP